MDQGGSERHTQVFIVDVEALKECCSNLLYISNVQKDDNSKFLVMFFQTILESIVG